MAWMTTALVPCWSSASSAGRTKGVSAPCWRVAAGLVPLWVAGRFRSPHKGVSGAMLGGDGGVFVVIGGEDDVVEQAALKGGGDRLAQHRRAEERLDVLAGMRFEPPRAGMTQS